MNENRPGYASSSLTHGLACAGRMRGGNGDAVPFDGAAVGRHCPPDQHGAPGRGGAEGSRAWDVRTEHADAAGEPSVRSVASSSTAAVVLYDAGGGAAASSAAARFLRLGHRALLLRRSPAPTIHSGLRAQRSIASSQRRKSLRSGRWHLRQPQGQQRPPRASCARRHRRVLGATLQRQ
jgi:hypothetical protein